MNTKFNFAIITTFLVFILSACQERQTGFSIVVDAETYNNAKEAIDKYAEVLEEEGLKTYMLVKDYPLPDSLKNDLMRLYTADVPIEGAVFIGDIPVARVIDAQHLTSAFKMDQKRYGFERANVPTDRFYDDFDLEWSYMQQDSTNQLHHYYSLNFDSPQELAPDIYTGRIKMPEKENKYELLRNYLKKVVEAHRTENPMDEFFFFAGNGYNSESLTARLHEKAAYHEQFPGSPGISFLDYSMETFIKWPYMSELQREDLDMAIVHHHGSEDTEYLSGWPRSSNYVSQIDLVKRFLRLRLNRAKRGGQDAIEKVKQSYNEEYGIPESWWEGALDEEVLKEDSIWSANLDLVLEDFELYSYAPDVRFIILDACYNGSFYEDNYMAGSYISSPGKTVAAQGNTVNVLQDKWAQEMAGLLSLGMRVGEWNRLICTLETHIIGDPTFRFTSLDPSLDIHQHSVNDSKNNKVWLKLMNSEYPDVQALALKKLYKNSYEEISGLLLQTYKNAGSGSLRAQCLRLASRMDDENFLEMLKLALEDDYELVQRFAVKMAGKSGNEQLIPPLVKIAFRNIPKRVAFNYRNNITFFNNEKLLNEFEKQADKADFLIRKEKALPRIKEVFEDANNRFEDVHKAITEPETKEKVRYFELRTLRNYNYHMGVPDFIQFVEESDDQEERIMMIEALGWFNLSVNKQQIIDFCEKLANDDSESEEIREEAHKTVLRLS